MKYVTIVKDDHWNIASPASIWFDRHIRFRKGEDWAVVCSMFYGRKESKHRSAEAVVKKCGELVRQGYPMHTILHVSGGMFVIVDGKLVRRVV